MQKPTPIIIRRQSRRGAKPARASGAWKVAFADFTLAMMAFFIVLWILSVSNIEERRKIAEHLRSYSVFEGEVNPFNISNSPHPMDMEGDASIVDAKDRLAKDGQKNLTARSLNMHMADSDGESGYGELPELSSRLRGRVESAENLALLADEIDAMADAMEASTNIETEVVPQGIRIMIRDDEDNKMFKRGSARMTPFFEDLLLTLAPVFRRIDNRLMISGHTDASQFHNAAYTNWELSGDRALQARQVLEVGGMPPARVAQVVAMSDRMPMDPDNPTSSANRRIELLLLTETAEKALETLFSSKSSSDALEKMRQQAKDNQPILRSEVLQENAG